MARTKKTETIVDDILATEKPTTKKGKATTKTEKTEKVSEPKTVDAEKEDLKEQNKQMAEMLKQMQAQIEQLKAESNEVQVIPGNNIIKDKELINLINDDPLSPDILSSAKYTGSVTGSSGLKTALIQIGSGNEILVLSIGETVGDSDWELKEIYTDYVIFRAGETTKKINLS